MRIWERMRTKLGVMIVLALLLMVAAGVSLAASYPFTATFRVVVEKAVVENAGNGFMLYTAEGATPIVLEKTDAVGTSESGGNISDLGGYYNELKYFVEGLQGKNDLSVATVAEAIKSVQLVKREIEAAGGLIVK